MEKEVLVSKLKPLLGVPDAKGFYSNGVTDRTLDTYAASIAAGVDDNAGDEVFAIHKGILDAMGGQLRFELGEFTKNYKPSQTPPSTPPVTPPGDDALSKVLEKLNEMEQSNKDLKQRLDQAEQVKSQGEYRDQLVKAMKGKGADNDYVLEKALLGLTFDTKKSIDEIVEEHLTKYDSEYSRCYGNGETPRNPQAQGGAESKLLDKFFAEKEAEGKMPKSE